MVIANRTAGIVDQYVDATQCFEGRVGHLFRAVIRDEFSDRGDRTTSACFDHAYGLLRACCVTAMYCDRDSLCGKRRGNRDAKPRAGAGDQCPATRKIQVHADLLAREPVCSFCRCAKRSAAPSKWRLGLSTRI